jgi:hypothetical protein
MCAAVSQLSYSYAYRMQARRRRRRAPRWRLAVPVCYILDLSSLSFMYQILIFPQVNADV